MNKHNAKDYLPLVQALAEGKDIQFFDDVYTKKWFTLSNFDFDNEAKAYRVKPETHPAESWPVDAKILVQDYEGGEWIKRYFAKFENGRLHAWLGGGTSWSANGHTSVWGLAKLAEADDGQD